MPLLTRGESLAQARHGSGPSLPNDGEPMTSTPIKTGFTAESTAAEVIAGTDLSGARAIVTGGASGIGLETARVLSLAGAEVTLAVRNVHDGQQLAADMNSATGRANVQAARLDLADLASVEKFVRDWRAPLHLLINNAGIMALPQRQVTPDGWELQFATNHLGHFALTAGLHAALAAAGGSRIVSLSSRGHLRSPVHFDDINYVIRPYDPLDAYGQSKTANVLLAVEATRRWADDGITANAVHPGAIRGTNLGRHMSAEVLDGVVTTTAYRFKSIEQGAATTVLVAISPLLEGIGGRYFEDCNESTVIARDVNYLASQDHGVAPYALDPANAHRLWEISKQAVA